MKAFILFIISTLALTGFPQETVVMTVSEENQELTVSGTSTLHDWEMDAGELNGDGKFTIEENKLKGIENLSITIPVKTLKSGKSKMDNNAYAALKADDYPTIRFALKQVNSITPQGDEYLVNASGNLTIAGNTKPITLKTYGDIASNGLISFRGSTSFKMSEYGVEPPSVMWGTVTTGDEVTIKYNVSFNQ